MAAPDWLQLDDAALTRAATWQVVTRRYPFGITSNLTRSISIRRTGEAAAIYRVRQRRWAAVASVTMVDGALVAPRGGGVVDGARLVLAVTLVAA